MNNQIMYNEELRNLSNQELAKIVFEGFVNKEISIAGIVRMAKPELRKELKNKLVLITKKMNEQNK